MKIKVNGCVSCGLPCLYHCSYRDDTYEYYCDDCGEEFSSEDLYEYDDGRQLCQDCLCKNYPTIAELND